MPNKDWQFSATCTLVNMVQRCRNKLNSKTDFLNWKSVFCYLSS